MEHTSRLFFLRLILFFVSAGAVISERNALEELAVNELEDVSTRESESGAAHGPEDLQHLQESEQRQEQRLRPHEGDEVPLRGIPDDGQDVLGLRRDVHHDFDHEIVAREHPHHYM